MSYISTESVRAKAEPEDQVRLRAIRAEAQCELLRLGVDVREIKEETLSPAALDAAFAKAGTPASKRIAVKSLCAQAGWLS